MTPSQLAVALLEGVPIQDAYAHLARMIRRGQIQLVSRVEMGPEVDAWLRKCEEALAKELEAISKESR